MLDLLRARTAPPSSAQAAGLHLLRDDINHAAPGCSLLLASVPAEGISAMGRARLSAAPVARREQGYQKPLSMTEGVSGAACPRAPGSAPYRRASLRIVAGETTGA